MWAIGILLGVIGVLLGRLLKKFDAVIDGLTQVNQTIATHKTRLDNVDQRFTNTDNRLNDHAKRIRDIELTQAKTN